MFNVGMEEPGFLLTAPPHQKKKHVFLERVKQAESFHLGSVPPPHIFTHVSSVHNPCGVWAWYLSRPLKGHPHTAGRFFLSRERQSYTQETRIAQIIFTVLDQALKHNMVKKCRVKGVN